MNYPNFKQILLLALLLLTLCCNKDDDDSQAPSQNYIYDGCVPLTKEFKNPNTSQISNTLTYEYQDGRLTTIQDADGLLQVYEYEGDRVRQISEYFPQDVLLRVSSYDYNDDDQITHLQYLIYMSAADSFQLRRGVDYHYENGILKQADMVYRGEASTLFYHGGNLPDSIEYYDENDKLQRKEIYTWDGKNSEYRHLNIPIVGHFETPLPFAENATRIVRKQYDDQGRLLQTATSLCPVDAYNSADFPLTIQCSSSPIIHFDYGNCE